MILISCFQPALHQVYVLDAKNIIIASNDAHEIVLSIYYLLFSIFVSRIIATGTLCPNPCTSQQSLYPSKTKYCSFLTLKMIFEMV